MFAYIREGVVVHVSGSNSEPMDNTKIVEIPVNTAAQFGYLYDGSAFSQPPTTLPQTITKTHLLLAFTSAERVKARSLRATDPILDDFWMVLDGSDTVNLSLPSVQAGIEYTLNAVKSGGLAALNVALRKADILAGKLQ